MALINCPECGEQISTAAKECVHCGYPLIEYTQSEVKYAVLLESVPNINSYIISQIAFICPGCEIKRKINNLPCVLTKGLSLQKAKAIQSEINKLHAKAVISEYEEKETVRFNNGTLRCPRCKSTSITTGAKGYGLVRGFLGSNKTVNRCGSCGYSWEP